MTARGPSGLRRHAPRLGAVIALLTAAVAGAAAARIEVPAELPLVTNEQLFQFRRALQREPTRAQALGHVTASTHTAFRLTLALFGLDAEGRIASRGQGIRPD